jgi:sec-independent protein translocase protein TatA
MGLSMGHLLIILLIVLLVFGAGRLPKVMGDLGKGLKHFREGMNSPDETPAEKSKDERKS